MGGCCCETDSEVGNICDRKVLNIVLVGRTGNGKSATGNTILRKNSFVSKNLPRSVTTECELQQATLEDGSIVNVIDTPGLFDTSHGYEHVATEIARCISLAEGGIHAVLLVLSLSRFTEEEGTVVKQLQSIFGEEICDHMIVVFTCSDRLDEDQTMDDYITASPDALKELLKRCGNRTVAFDNRTKDDVKKSQQISKLLNLVEDTVNKNGGKPYSNEFFLDYQKGVERTRLLLEKAGEWGSTERKAEMSKLLEEAKRDQLQNLTLMVISKLTSLEEETCKLREELSRSTEKVAKLETKLENNRKKAEEELEKAGEKAKEAESARMNAEAERKRVQDEIHKLEERKEC